MLLSSIQVEQLVEKWDSKGFKLGELSDDIVKRNTAILLENEHRYILQETASLSTDIADFKKILMPLTRRIFPNLLANEIVGVQPMAGPVSLAYALRFRAGDANRNYNGGVGQEVGYNTIDGAYTGTTDATWPNSYLTQNSGQTGPNTGSNYAGAVTASAQQWSATDNQNGYIPEAKTTIESVTVTAKTRKMKARYSLEAAQDLKNMHGLDIEAELTNMLQYEVGAEIDRELVNGINILGGVNAYTYVVSGGDTRGEAEKFRTLYTRIVREAAAIAKRTRRGAGNFIIASGNVVTALDSLGTFLMQPLAGANPMDIGPGVAKVGSIENRFAVYRDTFATTDYATVGFKGQGTQNSGIIYCPYIPLMISKAVEPGNFTPVIGLMTRYGIVSHLLNSNDFYTKIGVDFGSIAGFETVI
jgi:hypothetical protein